MSKVKYIRVSTEEQNTARQEVNAKEFSTIYIDKTSGSVQFTERKEAKKLLADIESGIVTEIHISSIDRLGRNIIDILTVVEFLTQKSIKLFVENIGMYSLIDNKPNPSFKMIVSVLGNVAEMERLNMLERQRQGIELAKAKGTYTGRLFGSKMSDAEVLIKYKSVVKELKNGESLRRASKIGGCSLGTAQKIQRLLNPAVI
ncbi:recombinase family protein [Flavobacterium sp. GSP27]|uniref:recombinase family protein n=1 Tax=Flavobacterium sp. GSP27 TaxID=2497489 RepID=UPI000F83AB35|nr:recombinase family protein [Flavobacterium sp. GSP27]RTZ09852.1 recombinase family protein [Flavobacterium sp. GSP27]